MESATSVATLVDDTYVHVEFYYDGDTVSVYVDGSLVTTVADSAATFPNNELLRLTLEAKNQSMMHEKLAEVAS